VPSSSSSRIRSATLAQSHRARPSTGPNSASLIIWTSAARWWHSCAAPMRCWKSCSTGSPKPPGRRSQSDAGGLPRLSRATPRGELGPRSVRLLTGSAAQSCRSVTIWWILLQITWKRQAGGLSFPIFRSSTGSDRQGVHLPALRIRRVGECPRADAKSLGI
jgi:hypothetical protein